MLISRSRGRLCHCEYYFLYTDRLVSEARGGLWGLGNDMSANGNVDSDVRMPEVCDAPEDVL